MRVWYTGSRGVQAMKTINAIATIIAFGLALGACTSESTTMAQDELDGVGGSDYGTATQSASVGGSSVAVTTVVQFVEVPKEVVKLSACVPGAQTGCTCTDGSSGAQVCQDDGTMGVCECEAPVAYSGDCVAVGVSVMVSQTGVSNSCYEYAPVIHVNCSSRPVGCDPPSSIGKSVPGVFCCPS
jgi:hypothetical protein